MENTNVLKYSLIEQENIIESILFMMGESVSVDTLAIAIESDVDVAREAAERLYNKYQNEYQDRGMKVIKLGNKFQMVSNNKYFKNLVLVASKPQKPIITEAVLETLSIIAYKQPISKPEIEHIRGVKSDYACNRLLEYGLVEEKGRLETAGRPILFGTTEEFMLRFGIESLDDLPILDATRFAEIEAEVEKELSETLQEKIVIDKDKYVDEISSNLTSINETNIEPVYVNNNEDTKNEEENNKVNDELENDKNVLEEEIISKEENEDKDKEDNEILNYEKQNEDTSFEEEMFKTVLDEEDNKKENKIDNNTDNNIDALEYETNLNDNEEPVNSADEYNKNTLEGEGPQ